MCLMESTRWWFCVIFSVCPRSLIPIIMIVLPKILCDSCKQNPILGSRANKLSLTRWGFAFKHRILLRNLECVIMIHDSFIVRTRITFAQSCFFCVVFGALDHIEKLYNNYFIMIITTINSWTDLWIFDLCYGKSSGNKKEKCKAIHVNWAVTSVKCSSISDSMRKLTHWNIKSNYIFPRLS